MKKVLIFFVCNYGIYTALGRSLSKEDFFKPSLLSIMSKNKNEDWLPKAGNWCFEGKDRSSFSLSFQMKHDSVYISYAYVKNNGNFLNAENYDGEYCVVVNKKYFLKSQQPIKIINYNLLPGNLAEVFIRYNKENKTVSWQLVSKDLQNTSTLPKFLVLRKCE